MGRGVMHVCQRTTLLWQYIDLPGTRTQERVAYSKFGSLVRLVFWWAYGYALLGRAAFLQRSAYGFGCAVMQVKAKIVSGKTAKFFV